MKRICTLFSAIVIFILTFVVSTGSFCAYAESGNTVGKQVFTDGVQIRLSQNRGLRFIACVSGAPEDYDEVGIIAIPQKYVSGELTLDTPNIAKISNLDSGFKYFDISESSFRYTLCFVNLKYEQFDRRYVVRPYVKYTEQGEPKTVYGDNYTDYILSPAEFVSAVLENYADNYTEADKANHDIIDDMLTGYEKYLDSTVIAPPEPEEPQAERFLALNEWYWKIGTLGSTNGAANETNTKRIYTPNYIPADGTAVTFDGAAGIKYIVMEYDKDMKWLSTSNWITSESYTKRNASAKFYRCVITDESMVSQDRIKQLASHLTVMTPEIEYSGAEAVEEQTPLYLKHSFFEIGNIGADGNYSPSEYHAYNSYYIPASVKFTYDASKNFSYKVYYYTADRAFISSTDAIFDEASPKAPESAAYFRIAVDPQSEANTENVNYIGSAFEFAFSVTPEEWQPGTISGSTGIENPSAAQRFYTPDYYPADGITINHNTVLKKNSNVFYIVLPYDADRKYMTNPGTSGDRPRSSDGVPQGSFPITGEWENASYFRFAMKTGANVTAEDAAGYAEWLDITYPALPIIEYIPPKEPDIVDDSGLNFRFSIESIGALSPGNYMSGLCMVEDELWLFSTSDKGSDGYGVALRYSIDFANKNAEYLGYFRHNFGHTNSIDYNEANKCLTFGNGSGSFSATENYMYVYQNAYEKVKNGAATLELSDAICFDWAECQIPNMTKLNTCWYGENSIFAGANNNGYVYKIALGTGSRILKYGTASEVSEGEFNGTWDIIKSYEMPDNRDNAQASGFRGQGYDQCNQGTCYADGTLYLTCGHNGVYFWRCRLDSDGSIKRDEFHKFMSVNGSLVTSAISGIDKVGDYLIFTNGGYVNIYLDSSLK